MSGAGITAQIYGSLTPAEIKLAQNSRKVRRVMIIDWLRDSGKIGLDVWLAMQMKEAVKIYESEVRP